MNEIDITSKLVQHDEQIKTLFNNMADLKKLTDTVAVYARSRGSNYYAYVPLITIIEE